MPRSLSSEARRGTGRGAGALVTGQVTVTVAVPQHFPTREDKSDCPMGRRQLDLAQFGCHRISIPMGRGCR